MGCVVPFDIVPVPPVQPGYKAGGRGSSSEQPLPRNIHIIITIPRTATITHFVTLGTQSAVSALGF
jgi:hypothetical protein